MAPNEIMPNILPKNSPFSPQQRAWLDGFLSAALSVNDSGVKSSGVNDSSVESSSVETVANGTTIFPIQSAPSLDGANANGAAPLFSAFRVLDLPEKAASNDGAKSEIPKKAAPFYTRDNPFPARVVHVTSLNGAQSAKDVRAVALDLTGSGLRYEAGDALGIYAENRATLVEEILEVLGATGEEPVVTPESRVVPMRIALTLAYDVMRINEDFLLLLAQNSDDEAAQLLRELAEDDAENWLEGRDVLDVLHRFGPCGAAPSEIAAALSPLQPRLYSISSSQKAHPNQVHLTVGVVRYEANERERNGVASTFLADFLEVRPGQKAGIFVHPSPGFRLPESGDTPIIMVGPGTGIAPFRAFLQERRATNARGKSWLFFGDQRAEHDFLYRDELEEHERDGSLSCCDTAFSRDQHEKIYVQTRMLQNAEKLWQWLEEGAHFYVCGDAKRMAKDVDAALQTIIAEQGQMSPADAKSYLQNLTKARRYQRDVY